MPPMLICLTYDFLHRHKRIYQHDAVYVDDLDYDLSHYDRFRRVEKHLAKAKKTVSNPPPKPTWAVVLILTLQSRSRGNNRSARA